MSLSNLESLNYFYPELILICSALGVILLDLLLIRRERTITAYLALLGLAISFLEASKLFSGNKVVLFSQMIALDQFALFFKLFFLFSTFMVVLFSVRSEEIKGTDQAEYYALLLAVALGMILIASAVDLLMIYISLELISLTSYLLTGYLKGNRRSSEAALKYFIYGAVASGVMIYGMSLIYGLTGTTNIHAVGKALFLQETYPLTLLLATIFVLAGFGYKIAAVPFHMWCPDVYEGAPTPVTAFLSVGPKAAGFAVLIRFFYGVMARPSLEEGVWIPLGNLNWPFLIAVLSAVTMTLGNLVAIAQSNIKRLLAYSSIAHAGYILMGFVLLNDQGLRAMLFYLAVYLFMNLGAFLVVIAVLNKLNTEEIVDYRGLGWRAPFAAAALTVFLLSLTGIPPFAGFIGKVYLFAALIKKEVYWLAVVGILNSVVALYYYAGIVKKMFLEEAPDTTPLKLSPLYLTLMLILIIPTVLFGVYWAPLVNFTDSCLKLLLSY
ncbi:MAG: NADH-quinone oxidoreductase subunit N [Deltaproteobacteria bacterium]|nr:MAG: NADH-quinone oxidoreductase subunit N [Deltaproteobacteria bacterium]